MIYSRWRPDQGGYDYFQSGERYALADDLPVPSLPPGTDIGVPSVDAGRSMPGDARFVGSGQVARGMIAPVSRSGLSGIGFTMGFGDIAAVALGFIAGWWIWGRKRKAS